MKFKSLIFSALCLSAVAFTSCDGEKESTYTKADALENVPAYFDKANADLTFKAGDEDTQIEIPIYRAVTSQSETVELVSEMTPAESKDLFTIPTSVTFAAGEDTQNIVITFSPTNLEVGVEYVFNFSIKGVEDSPYYVKSASATLTYLPAWQNYVGPNGETMGTFVDDITTTIWDYSPNPNPTWEVQIQINQSLPGVYRVVDPYASFPVSGFGYDNSTDHSLYLNAKDPDKVFMCDENGNALVGGKPYLWQSGLLDSEDEADPYDYFFYGTYNYLLSQGKSNADDYLGKLQSGVFSFPVNAFLFPLNGSLYYCNKNGTFSVQLPGADLSTVPKEWEEIGTGVYTDVLICPFYGKSDDTADDVESWTVTVEQNIANPGLYRMVNPYKDGVMPDGWIYDGDKYVVFDASEPNCVYVTMQQIWEDTDDPVNGAIYVTNLANNFKLGGDSAADIIAAGYNDTFANNTFTFRGGDLRMYFPNTTYEAWQGKLLTACSTVDGKLVITPSARANATFNYVKNPNVHIQAFKRALENTFSVKAGKQRKLRAANVNKVTVK